MSMNKKTTVREVGRRTRLRNADVQRVLETMIEVWTEELARGGRVEIEGFMVMEAAKNGKGRVRMRLSKRLACQIVARVIAHEHN
jgi:nucleoid DNA-binding protein